MGNWNSGFVKLGVRWAEQDICYVHLVYFWMRGVWVERLIAVSMSIKKEAVLTFELEKEIREKAF